jgi:hypothetical protein
MVFLTICIAEQNLRAGIVGIENMIWKVGVLFSS